MSPAGSSYSTLAHALTGPVPLVNPRRSGSGSDDEARVTTAAFVQNGTGVSDPQRTASIPPQHTSYPADRHTLWCLSSTASHPSTAWAYAYSIPDPSTQNHVSHQGRPFAGIGDRARSWSDVYRPSPVNNTASSPDPTSLQRPAPSWAIPYLSPPLSEVADPFMGLEATTYMPVPKAEPTNDDDHIPSTPTRLSPARDELPPEALYPTPPTEPCPPLLPIKLADLVGPPAPMCVPLRTTGAPHAMRRMMGVFRLDPFATHDGMHPATRSGAPSVAELAELAAEAEESGVRLRDHAICWNGEPAGPLQGSCLLIDFQVDLDDPDNLVPNQIRFPHLFPRLRPLSSPPPSHSPQSNSAVSNIHTTTVTCKLEPTEGGFFDHQAAAMACEYIRYPSLDESYLPTVNSPLSHAHAYPHSHPPIFREDGSFAFAGHPLTSLTPQRPSVYPPHGFGHMA